MQVLCVTRSPEQNQGDTLKNGPSLQPVPTPIEHPLASQISEERVYASHEQVTHAELSEMMHAPS